MSRKTVAARRLMLFRRGAASALSAWDSYALGQNPVLMYSMVATSGTTETNRGTGTGNATIGGTTTLGQTGQLGANQAHLLDGLTSFYQVTNHASFAGLTTWEWYFLINVSAAGEGNQGTFFFYSNSTVFRINAATRVLRCNVDGTTTDGNAITTTALSLSAWNLVRVTFDNTGDRIPHIWINDVEASYSTATAMVDAYVTPSQDLFLGNNATSTTTSAGLFDEALLFSDISNARSTQLKSLAGL